MEYSSTCRTGFSSSLSPGFLGLNLKKTKSDSSEARWGGETIYRWIRVTLDCLIKRICPGRTQLDDPIHIPDLFLVDVFFPFSQTERFFFHQRKKYFAGATSVTDWNDFVVPPPPTTSPRLPPPLVRSVTGTAQQCGEGSSKGDGDRGEVTKALRWQSHKCTQQIRHCSERLSPPFLQIQI